MSGACDSPDAFFGDFFGVFSADFFGDLVGVVAALLDFAGDAFGDLALAPFTGETELWPSTFATLAALGEV